MLVVGDIIDHERLERLEEQPRRTADARAAVALLAQNLAQFLQHQRGAQHRAYAGGLVAAQQAALELADQDRSRRRRKFAQVLPQPLDGVPSPAISGLIRMLNSRI